MNYDRLVTDSYLFKAAYGYWKAGIREVPATFELIFRHHPFGGEFTVFGGLDRVLEFVKNFHYTPEEIDYIREFILPHAEPEFFEWLATVDGSMVEIWAMDHGSLASPHVPLVQVKGPIAVAQLLETALIVRTSYPSLVATNAARYRLAAGFSRDLIEMGLRRGQGEDGGLTGAEYAYLGGFNATSNVEAGRRFGIPTRGTMLHAFVQAFSGLSMLKCKSIKFPDGKVCGRFVDLVLDVRNGLEFMNTNEGELAAFIAQAQAFPSEFLALVDTYNTQTSGVPNFICVAEALKQVGYQPIGIRIDSGDLAHESKAARRLLDEHSLQEAKISATNELTIDGILSLNQQECKIDTMGVGTHLITCKGDPSLGCVYKLVEFDGEARIKVSGTVEKMVIARRKQAYRLFGAEGYAIGDLMTDFGEKPPLIGEKALCLHPFVESKRRYVISQKVVSLLSCWWANGTVHVPPTLTESRQFVIDQLHSWRPDHLRFLNPTPYKVSVNSALYDDLHRLWRKEVPIPVFS